MNSIAELNLAYLAGLIDGEGCLAVIRQRNSHCRAGYAYRCGLRIANSNEPIMDWLVKVVGAGAVKSHLPKMRNSKRQWTWEVWGDDSANLTRQLLPHFRIKRPQADLLLAFQQGLKSRSGPYLTPKELAFRETCYHHSRALNQRGAKPYVSVIAKQYGGGGHEHAAGFKVSFAEAAQFEVSQ